MGKGQEYLFYRGNMNGKYIYEKSYKFEFPWKGKLRPQLNQENKN